MLSLLQSLFGGGTSTQTSQSTSTPRNFNPFTQALYGDVTGGVRNVQNALQPYQGPLSAGMTGNEGSLLQDLMNKNTQGGGATGTNDYLSSVLGGNFMPGSPGGNPFLEASITAAQRPTMNNLTDTLSRSLPGYFTANGHMISPNNNNQGGSSAFDTAAALATGRAAQTMGDIATNISSNAYTSERGNMQQAAQLSQQEVSNTISTLQAESLPRMIQELGIERGLDLYKTNVTGLLQLLQTLGGIGQPVLGNDQQSTGTGKMEQTAGIVPGVTGAFKAAFSKGA